MDYQSNVDGLLSSFFPGGYSGNAPAITATWCNQQMEFTGGIQVTPTAELSEMKQTFMQTSVGHEPAGVLAQQELRQMELQALHLLHLLNTTMQERDEARRLLSSQQHLQVQYVSPKTDYISVQQFNVEEVRAEEGSGETGDHSSPVLVQVTEAAVKARGLPEKGKLVEAVMSAGPLLQMLLLAGPLPQWQNPPPELRCSDIPPVSIGSLAKANVVHNEHCSGGNDRLYRNAMTYLNAR